MVIISGDLPFSQITRGIYENFPPRYTIMYFIPKDIHAVDALPCIVVINYSLAIPLTYWGRHNMAASFHTTFSNAFSSIKMYKFRLRLN